MNGHLYVIVNGNDTFSTELSRCYRTLEEAIVAADLAMATYKRMMKFTTPPYSVEYLVLEIPIAYSVKFDGDGA